MLNSIELIDVVKFLLIVSFSFVLYVSISKGRIISKSTKKSYPTILVGIVLVVMFTFFKVVLLSLSISQPMLSMIIAFVLGLCLSFLFKEKIEHALSYMAISYALSTLCVLVAILPSAFFTLLFAEDVHVVTLVFHAIFSAIIVFSVAWFIRKKIERLKISRNFAMIGLTIVSASAVFYTILRDTGISLHTQVVIFFGFIFLALGTVFLMRHETKTQSNEVLLGQLREQIHRDNGRVLAVEHTLVYLANTLPHDSPDRAEALALLRDVQTSKLDVAEERVREEWRFRSLLQTGMPAVDAVFKHMLQVLGEKGIYFSVAGVGKLKGIKKHITQTQLERLITDILNNAVIAIEHSEERAHEVRVYFRCDEEGYSLAFDDTGVPFDVNVLANLGVKSITTYADEGGSGIGYKTIFDTLRSCNASLIITENSPEEKTVEVAFDGKNELIYNTYRADELRKACAKTKSSAIIRAVEMYELVVTTGKY